MTRAEATKKLYSENLQATGINRADFLTSYSNVTGFVDALVSLGLLKLETKEEVPRTDISLAIEALECSADLCCTPKGARAVIDTLTKSGFRITRDK